MIVDWNRKAVKSGQVFHFKNSLRPFVEVKDTSDDFYFLDCNEMKIYTFDELEYEGLDFYTDETDDDFKGVEIDGEIKWVE